MPLLTVFSFRTPRTAENLKIFSINSRKSAQCMFYIRFMYVRQTIEGDYNTSWCFQTKTRHAAGRMKAFRKSHMTCWMLSIKKRLLSHLFVKNIRYLVGMSDVTTISNDQGNILQISCKTLLKQKEYCCVVQMHGLEHMQHFQWFWSNAVVLWLLKVFTSSLQHIWRTYRANICNQLIKNTTIVSVDVIRIKWCFPCTIQWLFLHVLAICL